MSKHLLEVEVNAEGHMLAILSPVDSKGNLESGYRISGPKAWGGSKNIARLQISHEDLVEYIENYAPKVNQHFVLKAVENSITKLLELKNTYEENTLKSGKDLDDLIPISGPEQRDLLEHLRIVNHSYRGGWLALDELQTLLTEDTEE